MTAWKILIWLAISNYIYYSLQQSLTSGPYEGHGICREYNISDQHLRDIAKLKEFYDYYKDCVVVLGNLEFAAIENTKARHFKNISFPKLKEVTGYMVVYRVSGIESVGQVFPNLARIRGNQLLNNYGLIVNDIDITKVGLYNLLKVDRGGVAVWQAPQACFVETIDWETIAPRYRHVLGSPEHNLHCKDICSCSRNAVYNRCWSNLKCQRFLDGPEGEKCHEQCFGCRKTKSTECTLCRNYTYRNQCLAKCPINTLVLPDNNYCLAKEECTNLEGWDFNNTCVFKCPVGYKEKLTRNEIEPRIYCQPCPTCHEVCPGMTIQTLNAIELAQRCVYINGSLTIHVRAVPQAMEEMKVYLSRIQVVSDYVAIYGSITITSLDFLPSLRLIQGKKLLEGKYSLVIYDMMSLQSLFTSDVNKNLKVEKGSYLIYKNPVLCLNEIYKIKHLFPIQPIQNELDIDTNGYSAGCDDVPSDLEVKILNETSVRVTFSSYKSNAHYSLLYVRIPPGKDIAVVPEACSESDWYAVNVPIESGVGTLELTSLQPASNYTMCLEMYDPETIHLARSPTVNFSTPFGKPPQPFVIELVASSAEVVVLRWVDHLDYRQHITRYELYATLIDISMEKITSIDYCKYDYINFQELEYSRHATVMKAPPNYDKGCESTCGVLSSVTAGALVEDYFDILSIIDPLDQHIEEDFPGNSSFGEYVRTMALNLTGPKDSFQVGGLAPFRDYRFKLKACIDKTCSVSATGTVRTLRLEFPEGPSITYSDANKDGFVAIHWDGPELTNGPLLYYTIEIFPLIKVNDLAHPLPQTWCVRSNETNAIVRSFAAKKYSVNVCSTTLGSNRVCSERVEVITSTESKSNWRLLGMVFGILLVTIALILGYLRKSKSRSDVIPLLNDSVLYMGQSEPPIFSATIGINTS